MAKKSFHEDIRALLRDAPEGMTAAELAAELGAYNASIWRSLRTMPDAFICGWERQANGAGRLRARWKAADIPPDAPSPEGQT